MFKRSAQDDRRPVHIVVDGSAVEAREGDTVSAALLASFDCLVTIDGVGNRQGCLVPVAEGMQIEIQKGKREIGR